VQQALFFVFEQLNMLSVHTKIPTVSYHAGLAGSGRKWEQEMQREI
jgi:hypothetical protein